jgi:hypothetical protein
MIQYPYSLKIDSYGIVYFSTDGGIRAINPTTNVLYNAIGNGCSGFSGDGGNSTVACVTWADAMWIDSNNVFYFTQTTYRRIRRSLLK